jgi:hypothetical protein
MDANPEAACNRLVGVRFSKENREPLRGDESGYWPEFGDDPNSYCSICSMLDRIQAGKVEFIDLSLNPQRALHGQLRLHQYAGRQPRG